MRQTNQTPPATAGFGDSCSKPPSFNTPSLNQTASRRQADARLRILAMRLHALGPRPLFHFLNEVESGADLREHLERYAALPADFIRAYGGDEFERPRAIGGSR